eukprot:UN04212
MHWTPVAHAVLVHHLDVHHHLSVRTHSHVLVLVLIDFDQEKRSLFYRYDVSYVFFPRFGVLHCI